MKKRYWLISIIVFFIIISICGVIQSAISSGDFFNKGNVSSEESRLDDAKSILSSKDEIQVGKSKNTTEDFKSDLEIDSDDIVMHSNGKTVNPDANSILDALKSGTDVIYLPEGNFDFGCKEITLKGHVAIIGAGPNKTILNNLCIKAPYGIEVYSVSFNGGCPQNISFAGGTKQNNTITILIKPASSDCRVIYKNSNFNGVDFASFICDRSKITLDSAENCTFTNIKYVAIYHSINSCESVYKNNIFKNIGETSILAGAVSGIWLGDVTNNTYTQSDNAIIEDNFFQDMYTAEDIQLSRHVLNANFICVRAIKAQINRNIIKDVHGYGEDREGLYTKVKNLTVSGNILENAGYGEGYITCKGQDGADAYTIISNNVIKGVYGSGIYLYGPGVIQNNEINITACKGAIVCHGRDSETSNKLELLDNSIYCEPGYYLLNGQKASNYNPKSVVYVSVTQSDLVISGNTIQSNKIEDGWKLGIDLTCIKKNIEITDNNIKVIGRESTGITLHSGADFSSYNKNISVKICSNNVVSNNKALTIQFPTEETNTARQFDITKNSVKSSDNSNCVIVNSGSNDVLVYSKGMQYNYRTNTKKKSEK